MLWLLWVVHVQQIMHLMECRSGERREGDEMDTRKQNENKAFSERSGVCVHKQL